VGRTKEFSSAPQDKGAKTNTNSEDGGSIPARRVTQQRFAADVGTQIRASGGTRPPTQAPESAATPPSEANPRSTLIMKPGQLAGATAAKAIAKPRKKYGLPTGQEQHTVVMSAQSGAAAIQAGLQKIAEESVVQESHPSSQNLQPPEIELVQHEVPRDTPYDSRLVLLADPDSEQAAAFRILRHHVLGAGHPQVIAVSGPHDGCGKTTTAINLAMALAECGRAQVLLIDANLRNPKIASSMRFVPPWCFASQLEKHRDEPFAPWSFVEIAQAGLHVAAIDPRGENRARLDAPAFAIALERLRLGPYEHIVIDCPSVLGNADVNLIQDATDGVLLAARTKHVTARDVRNAVDQLTPTKILGTTLFES
tara:strand:- start:42442 stop:43542 length:1101 start_codon:yes stop_codon:yes gene_type:complete